MAVLLALVVLPVRTLVVVVAVGPEVVLQVEYVEAFEPAVYVLDMLVELKASRSVMVPPTPPLLQPF
jgi:hypothetical protein